MDRELHAAGAALLMTLASSACVLPSAPGEGEPRQPAARLRRALSADGAAADAVAGGCGPVGYLGCCAGQTLLFCVGGALESQDCAPLSSCGWSEGAGLYVCGAGAGEDPTGQTPRACPGGMDGGPADGGEADGAVPGDGPQTADGPAVGGTCGALGYVGCCAGDELRFCSGGEVLVKACAPGTCGWNASGAYYACDTTGGASALYPRACAAVVGDGAAPILDGAADGPTPADSGPDLPGGDGIGPQDLPGAYDGFAVEEDGPSVPLEAGAGDGPPGDLAGIDAVGLDAAPPPGRIDVGSGGCGCGAGLSADAAPPALGLVWLLVAFAVRRRASGRR